jgi:hypothetical protein
LPAYQNAAAQFQGQSIQVVIPFKRAIVHRARPARLRRTKKEATETEGTSLPLVRPAAESGPTVLEQEAQAMPLPSGVASAVGSAGSGGALLWQKARLPASDLQRQTGNPTGGLRMTQAGWKINGEPIDHATFFRFEAFGDLDWTLGERAPLNRETIRVRFDVTILGQHLGLHDLVISYKPSGEAGQRNYTTFNLFGPIPGSNVYTIVIE